MNRFSALLSAVVLSLGAVSARGQSILYNFNTNNFAQQFTTISSGLKVTYSATGGIDDNTGGAPGGGLLLTGAGTAATQPKQGAYSPNDGLTYTISIYLKLNRFGPTGSDVLELALGQKTFPEQTGKGVGILLGNTSQGLSASVFQQNPKYSIPPSTGLSPAPTAGDWVKVSLTITETDAASGAFTYTSSIDDYGPTGVGAPTNLYTESGGTFTDPALAGSSASGWLPAVVSDVAGNNLDNLAISVSGNIVEGTLVVAKGDAAPGLSNAIFSVAGNPCIDHLGHIAFQALVTGVGKSSGITASNNSGIWLYTSAGTGSLIAQTGKGSVAGPGASVSGAAFSTLSDPLLSKDAVAFYAKLTPGLGGVTAASSAGIWIETTGTPTLQVRAGMAAPDMSSATVAAISQFGLNEDDSTPFVGTVSGAGFTPSNHGRLWIPDKTAALTPVASSANSYTALVPLALVAGQSRSVDVVNNYGAFLLKKPTDGAATEIELASPNSTSGFSVAPVIEVPGPKQTAASINAAPGVTGATVTSLDEPAVDSNGSVAFKFTMKGSGLTAATNTGIAVINGSGTASLLAQTGGSAPGTSGALYSVLSDPVLAPNTTSKDAVAFVASLAPGIGDTAKNGSNGQGIWSNANGSSVVTLLARKGGPAPGGGTFAGFSEIALTDDGTIIFQATISGDSATPTQAICYGYNSSTFLVARAGAGVIVGAAVKTIKSLKIFPISTYCMGQSRSFSHSNDDFAYTAFFTDGTWAIYVLHFS